MRKLLICTESQSKARYPRLLSVQSIISSGTGPLGWKTMPLMQVYLYAVPVAKLQEQWRHTNMRIETMNAETCRE